MPNILFASNSVSHFPGSIVNNFEWAYDAERVPYAIECPPRTVCSCPIFEATTTDETWFHLKMGASEWFVNNNEPIMEVVDINGDRIAAVSFQNRTNEGYHLELTATPQVGEDVRYLPMLWNQARTYDLRILYTDILARAELYVNEILVCNIEFSVASRRIPRYLWIGGLAGLNDLVPSHYSEIIVADGDTRNSRLDLLRPISAGVYGNWQGPLASLGDDDPTTGMTTTLANQSQSTILTPYTGANNISNIVQITTTVRGINSPDELSHFIRLSGVDYLTSPYAVDFDKEYQVTDWGLNPATSQPWAATDLVNVEFGFRSGQSV